MALTEISKSEFLRLAEEDGSRRGGLIYYENGRMAALYMELNGNHMVYTLLNPAGTSHRINAELDDMDE